jgi:type IV fimbrial biogenesis protein FimT
MLSRHTSPTGKTRGITMVEIMVVISILGLTLLAVMPDVTATIGNSRMRSSAETFTAGLARARIEAMRRNEPVTFWMMTANADRVLDNSCALSSISASWVVSVNNPGGACASQVNDEVAPFIQVKHDGGEASSRIAVMGTAGDRATSADSVTFDGYGRIAAGALRNIDLDSVAPSNDLRPLRIEMTNSGLVRMCEPRIDTASTDPRRCMNP